MLATSLPRDRPPRQLTRCMRPSQLPEDIRNLDVAPFPQRWTNVLTLVELSEQIQPGPLKDTLRGKGLVRTLNMSDLFLRLDQSSQLAADLRVVYDAHAASGEPFETFV